LSLIHFASKSFVPALNYRVPQAVEGSRGPNMTKIRSVLSLYEEASHDGPRTGDSRVEYPVDGMMAEERRSQILQILRSERRVKVNDLVTRFSTSAVHDPK
jgi:hypothetical protein